MAKNSAPRFAVVAFPYWQLTAQDIPGHQPAAILANGVITVCTPGAHALGVRVGQRRREALHHCPELLTLHPDEDREQTQFSHVLDTLLTCVARLEVISPGQVAVNATEPVRYYGSEEALLKRLRCAVDQASTERGLPTHDCAIGIAKSRFAAKLAGHTDTQIVADEETVSFLAPYPIETLNLVDFATLAHRLGIHTLADFAAIPHRDVRTRFGADIAHAHLVAQGIDPCPISHYVPPEPAVHALELEAPVDRVDMAAFAAKRIADQLTQELIHQGNGCTGIQISLETEHGEAHVRDWHTSIGFDADTLVERVRWQLAGWLASSPRERPTAGITRIEMSVLEVANAADLQLGLWGELSSHDRRAMRSLDRIRGLLGERSVMTAAVTTGRNPHHQAHTQPWGQRPLSSTACGPWPGQIPEPAPALVHQRSIDVDLVGVKGTRICVGERGALNEAPHHLCLPNGSQLLITSWAGPWLADESWWESHKQQRCARMQVMCAQPDSTTTTSDAAYLIRLQAGQWHIEATYD